MQHVSDIEQIENVILQLVLENSDSSTMLSSLANQLGFLFATEACIIVSTKFDFSHINQVNYWQQDTGLISDRVIDQLSDLTLAQAGDRAALVTQSSPIYQQLDHRLQKSLPTKTWLGIITQFQHQTNGLVLLLKSQSSQWTQTEQELLTKTLDLMAIAISQAQLQQQTQTKTRYQTLLKNLSREISQGYQPQILFNNCLSEVCQALQLDRGLILMLKYQNPLRAKGRSKNSVKGTARITCLWNAKTDHLLSQPELSFSLHNSDLCQKAWRHAPHSLKFETDAAFPDLTTDLLCPYGSALLMMPLMGRKTSETDSAMVLGFIVLQHDSFHYWSQDELELIDWVGVQVSTAIIHHQTLNQVQLIVDERTAQLKSSIDVQAKLSAKMRQHIKQLQKLNQLKDDFMNSMSHELKTPLTSMKMAIKMLRQAQIPPEMREKYLDILEQEWHREYNLIKDLLTLQQLESGELDFSPQELNLQETIDRLTQSFSVKWQESREITLVSKISEPNLKIYTDAESLEQVLNELLANAGKYSDSHTTIEISISSQRTIKEENIVIAVTNVGTGIMPEELPHIFDKFRRGQGVTDRAVPGTGLGLTLVQYLVEHLQGTIEVTSNPLDDECSAFLTTFVLRLPQIQPSIS
ncbi:MAG: HAMP domain-containing sensor histidine kinase [Cyanobacteria bacterium P01_G01_bin.67]